MKSRDGKLATVEVRAPTVLDPKTAFRDKGRHQPANRANIRADRSATALHLDDDVPRLQALRRGDHAFFLAPEKARPALAAAAAAYHWPLSELKGMPLAELRYYVHLAAGRPRS